jgi:hypothetical protein
MRILIATPNAEGHVSARHCESVVRLCLELARRDIGCEYAPLTWSDLEMSRNVLASRAASRISCSSIRTWGSAPRPSAA